MRREEEEAGCRDPSDFDDASVTQKTARHRHNLGNENWTENRLTAEATSNGVSDTRQMRWYIEPPRFECLQVTNGEGFREGNAMNIVLMQRRGTKLKV